MATYLPTKNLSPLWDFFLYDTTTSVAAGITALQTALSTAYSSMHFQIVQDTTAGKPSNAVVIVNDQQAISVAPANYVGFNLGAWMQLSSDDLDAQFTAYTP